MKSTHSVIVIGNRSIDKRPSFLLMSLGVSIAVMLAPNIAEAAKNTVDSISLKAQKLIIATEGKELSPYYIEGRSNEPSIGYGFNVRQNVLSRGAPATKKILLSAGIPESDVVKLMSSDKKISSSVVINQGNANKLLSIVADEQTSWVRGKVGAVNFSKMPAHRLAATVWFAYSGGAFQKETSGFFPAMTSGNVPQAMECSNYKVRVNGKVINNPNIVIFQSAFASEAGFKKAVENPDFLRRQYRTNNEYAYTFLPKSEQHVSVKTLRASPEITQQKQAQLSTEDQRKSLILSSLSDRSNFSDIVNKKRDGNKNDDNNKKNKL